jgi:ATP-dependent Clp protease ATP-binding subunit ClpA
MARFESQRLGHASTAGEHFLLALIYEREQFTLRLFEHLGVDGEALRERTLARMAVPPTYRAAEHANLTEGPYERFDEASRQVLAFAREESTGLGHYWIGDDHILLALARVADNSAPEDPLREVFGRFGLTAIRLREEVAKIQPPRRPRHPSSQGSFTGVTKLIIELALQRADDGAVTPLHLARAVAKADGSMAHFLLSRSDVSPADLLAALE